MTFESSITLGNIISMGAMFVSAIGAFFWVKNNISSKVDRRDFDTFQIQVAKEYVSTEHLQKVESRMTTSMEVLANEIRGLRSDLLAMYKERKG